VHIAQFNEASHLRITVPSNRLRDDSIEALVLIWRHIATIR
jgi:hypothetical protein